MRQVKAALLFVFLYISPSFAQRNFFPFFNQLRIVLIIKQNFLVSNPQEFDLCKGESKKIDCKGTTPGATSSPIVYESYNGYSENGCNHE